MPHYADGLEALTGDIVYGTTYNRQGRLVVGTVVSVTPGSDSCNCIVAFVTVHELPDLGDRNWWEITKIMSVQPKTFHSGGKTFVVEPDVDHGETRAFSLIRRADGTRP
jgi:hypothetical protein